MGLLGGIFDFLDPVLDTIDPMHNKVQEWTTGSKTTKGQSPYFETIAPIIVDAFLPGWGSALGAADGVSTGNWTKAGLSALGSVAGFGGFSGAGASEGLGGGLSATSGTTGLTATEGLSGVGAANSGADALGSGLSASSSGLGYSGSLAMYGSDAGASYSDLANADSARSVYGGANSNGWQYFDNGTSISPDGSYYHKGEMVTGAGGQSKGLLDYAKEYSGKANRAFGGNTSGGKLAQTGGKMLLQNMQESEQQAKQRAMMQQMNARGAVAPMMDDSPSRPAQSFQTLTPYSQFEGGYNPRKYGANVRRGLL